jgi:hypothetical protein
LRQLRESQVEKELLAAERTLIIVNLQVEVLLFILCEDVKPPFLLLWQHHADLNPNLYSRSSYLSTLKT